MRNVWRLIPAFLRLRLQAATLLAAVLVSTQATAGFIFFPGLDEYAPLARGEYLDLTLTYTSIGKVFDEHGNKVDLGGGQVPADETINSLLLLPRFLWVGNVFRDTNIPILSTRNQVFRVILPVGKEWASSGLQQLSGNFGLKTDAMGTGDPYLLGGIYSHTHHWGPVQLNGLFSTTVKIPVGEYDRKHLLNIGSNYWTVAPQLALHMELFGRLFIDATAAYQFNGRDHDPAYGGLYPSDPANLYNLEASFGWKWTPRFYTTLGVLYRTTVEPNRFKNPSLTLVDQPTGANPPLLQPLGPLADLLGGLLPGAVTNPALFFTRPHPGIYEDRGIRSTLLSAGANYVYRDSMVFDFRVIWPLSGRGSFFTLPYDVYLGTPSGQPLTTVNTRVNGTGEAAAVSASPLFLLRLVYIPWAP